MAKNIDFMGATFPDVPSIRLPQHEGGLVSFDDTTDATATADKILQGYTAYANGQKLVGTASGGITPSGTISITQNGQVDVTQYAIADVNVSGGGGASNLVHGEFTFDTEGVYAVSVPYSGNGYPLCAIVCPKGGTRANTTWKNAIRRYAVGEYALVKTELLTEPTFASSISQNEAVVMNIYKSSTSNASSKSSGWTSNYLLGNSDAQNTNGMMFKFKGNAKTLSVYVVGTTGTGYGFLAGITYEYYIVYSS